MSREVAIDPARDGRAAARLALAEAAIGAAAAAGADEAEALVMAEDAALTRFANSQIHQNVAETNAQVSLRVAKGRRVAVVATGRSDPEGIARLAAQACHAANLVEEAPDWPGLPDPRPITPVSGAYAPATAAAAPELRAAGARAVIAAADAAGVTAYGSFATAVETIAVASSRGVRAAESRTRSQLISVMMGDGDGTGYAEAAATDVEAIDAAAIGRECADRARRSARPIAIEPGEYPVVLEPYAVSDILDLLGYVGFSGLAVEEGRSFHEPGRRVGSDLVTIRDDAADTAATPASFDYEGLPTEPVTLIERGVCREVVWDHETAARAGRRSTGHGLPAPNPYGPFPIHSQMAAGTSSRAELLGGLKRGLLVTRFHYTNVVHPKLAVVTGMTRDGTFLVEDGEIVGPVRNLRFTQSYLDALAGVEAVGAERRLLGVNLGTVLVPAVRIAAWRFTGATATG